MDSELDKKYSDDELVMLTSIRSIQMAEEIKEILENAGIQCFLRNLYSDMMLGGMVDLGGIRIDIRAEDVEKALEILDSAGIVLPDENETTVGHITKWADNIPLFRSMPLEKRLWAIIGLIFIILIIMAIVATIITRNFV